MATRRRLGLGVFLGVAASATFGISGPMARSLFEIGWTPIATVFWRCLLASVVLVPFGLWSMRGRLRDILAEWRVIVAFGAMGVACSQFMFYSAVSRMDVGVALLIEYMAPVLLVAVAWARTRRAPSGLVLAGVAAAVAGLVCVLNPGGATPDPLGVVFALISTVGAACYFVIGARTTRLSPIALSAFGLPCGAALLGVLILLGVVPYATPLRDVAILGQPFAWWVPLAVVAVMATALAYALGVTGSSLMGARLSSFVSLSEVLFAAVLSAILLGEIPAWLQLVGAVLIITGVVLVRLAADDDATPKPLAVTDLG